MGKAFTDRWGVPVRAGSADAVALLDETAMGERELHHLRAARHWVEGNWEATARSLERALLCHPRDLLALKVAQDLCFFLGNRLELRDTAARVLPAWPRDLPGWGYVQGIYAFGLEENADYRQAETRARAALDHNPNAVGGSHAQRDVIDLTLIAAAARAGHDGLARALVTERVARKRPRPPPAS